MGPGDGEAFVQFRGDCSSVGTGERKQGSSVGTGERKQEQLQRDSTQPHRATDTTPSPLERSSSQVIMPRLLYGGEHVRTEEANAAMVTNPGVFPFGQPVAPVVQRDRSPKEIFVLGVYASAVHARWIGPEGGQVIAALAVASEPSIFWRGEDAEAIISTINVPREVGRLEPASRRLNGPSGRALDEQFLHPLGVQRSDAWLCDLVPHSCMNPRQAAAVEREYMPLVRRGLVPAPRWSEVPKELASPDRIEAIEAELVASRASIVVTLGDQPLRWFTRRYGSGTRLSAYGTEKSVYGRLHPMEVRGRAVSLLPLVHPRQAAGLGGHSTTWRSLHGHWVEGVAPRLLGR